MDHHLNEEYAAAALLKRHQLTAEAKEAMRGRWRNFFLGTLMSIVLTFCMIEYRNWREHDWFTPPAGVLTESEFRELVDGYPLLAEVFSGTYSVNTVCVTRGETAYDLDTDGDGTADVQVLLSLFGKYRMMGYQNILREPEALQYSGRRQHYDVDQLFKGRAWAVKAESIYVSNHEAEIAITVRDPEKGHVQARAEIEKLLAIVRQGEAD